MSVGVFQVPHGVGSEGAFLLINYLPLLICLAQLGMSSTASLPSLGLEALLQQFEGRVTGEVSARTVSASSPCVGLSGVPPPQGSVQPTRLASVQASVVPPVKSNSSVAGFKVPTGAVPPPAAGSQGANVVTLSVTPNTKAAPWYRRYATSGRRRCAQTDRSCMTCTRWFFGSIGTGAGADVEVSGWYVRFRTQLFCAR